MQHWTERQPPNPSRGIGIGLAIIAVLWMVALLVFAGKAGATPVSRCGGPCPTVPTTVPECDEDECTPTQQTTIPTTIATTTIPTTIATTTTVCEDCTPTQQTAPPPTNNCGLCAGQFSPPPTTAPAATTVPAATTTAVPVTTVAPATTVVAIPGTTAADQTLPATVAPVTAAEASSSTLPVTGSDLAWRLVPIALALLILGGVALAAKRS